MEVTTERGQEWTWFLIILSVLNSWIPWNPFTCDYWFNDGHDTVLANEKRKDIFGGLPWNHYPSSTKEAGGSGTPFLWPWLLLSTCAAWIRGRTMITYGDMTRGLHSWPSRSAVERESLGSLVAFWSHWIKQLRNRPASGLVTERIPFFIKLFLVRPLLFILRMIDW